MPDETVTIECGGDEYVWGAAARQGGPAAFHLSLRPLPDRAGQLLSGEVDQRGADTYLAEDMAEGFVLLCRTRPLTDLQIRTHM